MPGHSTRKWLTNLYARKIESLRARQSRALTRSHDGEAIRLRDSVSQTFFAAAISLLNSAWE